MLPSFRSQSNWNCRNFWWSWRCGVVESGQATEVIPQPGRVYILLSIVTLWDSWTGDNDHCPCAVIHENEVNDCSHCPCAVMHENWVSGSVGHGWLHKNNGHCPCSWGQWLSHKVTMERVYKPCLTGESPQLLVVSQAGNISLSRAYAPEGLGNVTPTGDSPVQFS